MKFILPVVLSVLGLAALPASATEYDPGFGEYDPNRICYQAWCYMGKDSNQVGSIVEPHNYDGGVGLGAFIGRTKIEFMEQPFAAGQYQVRARLVSNRNGSLVTEEIYAGPATYHEAVVSMPFSPALADRLKQGRFLKVYIYRGGQLDTSATFPLYGFTKAYGHMR